MNVFGIIVAGRLLQTEFVQAGDTQFVTTINDADSINHVVVFLTGVQPFPDHMAGSVYIRWPNANASMIANEESVWHCLGYISNDKPSAIFRIARLNQSIAKSSATNSNSLFVNNMFNSNINGGCAQIGISVESLIEVMNKTPAAGTAPSQQTSMVEFCEKMLQSFVNHAQSYAVRFPRPDNAMQSIDYIPAAVVQDWFAIFQRRLKDNPNFWKSLA